VTVRSAWVAEGMHMCMKSRKIEAIEEETSRVDSYTKWMKLSSWGTLK